MSTFPAKVKSGDGLPFSFCLHTEVAKGGDSGCGASWMGFESQLWLLIWGGPASGKSLNSFEPHFLFFTEV